MNLSKVAVVVNAIIGKVQSILGYSIVSIMVLSIFGGVITDVGTLITIMVMTAGGVLLIIAGAKTKGRIKRFKKYVGLISSENMTSIDSIAHETSQSFDFVMKDLQKMIDKNFFANAKIVTNSREIVIGNHKQSQMSGIQSKQENKQIISETVSCHGCGANNTKQVGIIISCEYCGTSLK